MAGHIVIVQERYARKILAGTKTVECRLSRNRVPPFGSVRRGDRLFIKVSGRGFVAEARAGRVWSAAELSPADVAGIRRDHGRQIAAEGAFWTRKRTARYATLIWLTGVVAATWGPSYKPRPMVGWHVLPAGTGR